MKNILEIIKDRHSLERFVSDNKDMLIKAAAALALVIAAFFIFISDGGKEEEMQTEDHGVTEAVEEETAFIYVDIGGEVANPMVAQLEEGSRVEDAIEAAGGVTDRADLTDINRAAFVEDGEKIFIPTSAAFLEAESAGGSTGIDGVSMPVYTDDRININTADSEELQTLNGVGPATAEKIIDYREANGRFSAIEDIMEVSGIGEKTFEKFKEEIKV